MGTIGPLTRSVRQLLRGGRPAAEDLTRLALELGPSGGGDWVREASRWLAYNWPGDRKGWLRDLQDRKTRQTVDYLLGWSPFYETLLGRAGVRRGEVRRVADLEGIPFTTKADLQSETERFMCRHESCVFTTQIQTSGTTGEPIVMFLTRDEVEYYASLEALFFKLSGQLAARDIAQVHLSMDASTEIVLFEQAARKLGAAVLRFGTTGSVDDHLGSLLTRRSIPGKKPAVSVLGATPSHLVALIERAAERGIELRETGLERLFTGGAEVSEATRRRASEAFGLPLNESYAAAEIAPLSALQCPCSDALHWNDYLGLLEVVHPDTGAPVADGEVGVAAVTTFYPDREGMPLLRYRLGDLLRVERAGPCPCGSSTTRIVEIVGRADEMVVVGGRNFFAGEIGRALAAALELDEPPPFELRAVEREGGRHAALLTVELDDRPGDEEERGAIESSLATSVFRDRYWQVEQGIVEVEVRLVEPGVVSRRS